VPAGDCLSNVLQLIARDEWLIERNELRRIHRSAFVGRFWIR
jgi:hypothetical protein